MAGKFKYLKKAITTITKGPRKGGKYTRYHYKAGAGPGKRALFKKEQIASFRAKWQAGLTGSNAQFTIAAFDDPTLLREMAKVLATKGTREKKWAKVALAKAKKLSGG